MILGPAVSSFARGGASGGLIGGLIGGVGAHYAAGLIGLDATVQARLLDWISCLAIGGLGGGSLGLVFGRVLKPRS